ncbi:MAG TPA: ABC transporter permease [Candidatus Eisenbacteria bacterium]|nr:ABC transporter permease [Candidatus Eisenbacteria bacterium]
MTGQIEGFRFGLRLFGGGLLARARAWQTIHRLQQNFVFALRLLRRNLGFTTVAVATLAIGIGANTAIFSVIYAVLLAPLPYPHPEQLVMVWSRVRDGNNSVSAGDFLDWKRQNKTFQDLVAWTGDSYNFATPDQPERIVGRAITPGAYRLMGDTLFLGRDFLPEEGEVGRDHVVILTHRLWLHLGADRNIIGKQIKMDGEPYTVVGVNQAGQIDRLESQFVVPLSFKPDQVNHDFHWLLVIGRLKSGVSLAQAQADMNVVTARIAQEHPLSNKGWSSSVEALHNDFFPKENQRILWLLMGAVGLVLLIACANVANLVLAKGTTRLREAAVRTSLGATRRQLFGQFLTENLVLAATGGGFGIALGALLLRVLVDRLPAGQLPSEADVTLNIPVLLFSLAATTIAGALFGCIPAWNASRVDPNETLKDGGRSGTSLARHRLRKTLIVCEFALALTLLTGAGLALHSLWNLSHVDLGFRASRLLTFGLQPPKEEPYQPVLINTFYREALDRIKALPGVVNAEAATGMPLQGVHFGMPFSIAGQPVSDPSSRPGTGFEMVTPEYYETFGIEILKGRPFTEQDSANAPRVAVVNEAFVRHFLQNVDPLRQRVVIEELVPGQTKLGPPVEWQIVGVSRNIRNGGMRGEDFPVIDVPFQQSPWPGAGVVVRTAGDPAEMSKAVAGAIHSFSPDVPLDQIRTMDEIVDQSLVGDRFMTALYASFAGVALVLAAIGIYGVMAFVVAQRRHEIGLRIAFGASQERVLGLVLKEGMALAASGLGIGLIGAFFVGRILKGLLYGVGTLDAVALCAVAATLFAAAFFACYVPARRAARVNPLEALRCD